MNDQERTGLSKTGKTNSREDMLKLEAKYCSWGDTVHYVEKPNIFVRAEGSCLYDKEGTEYLDLQMLYSAASFGYKNKRLNMALKKQNPTTPISAAT